MFSDNRCKAIEQNLGAAAARWADVNSAGWVLDALADPRTAAATADRVIPKFINMARCGRCQGTVLVGQSCGCFDNGGQ